MAAENTSTVSTYLIERLKQLGVAHLFGVPGDYVLDFMDRVAESSIDLVGNCNELNAGYAADAYARIRGCSAVVVTYNVGGLSLVNAVTGALAEQVPMVVISGAPHARVREKHALMHHVVGGYDLQFEIFQKITVDAALLRDAREAPGLIDRVLLACKSQKGPVYLEIPVDMVDAPCPPPEPLDFEPSPVSNPKALNASLDEAVSLLDQAQSPVVLAGLSVHRFGMAQAVLSMVETLELPFSTTISSKSVLPELHPQFIGMYQGALCEKHIRDQVEGADCLVALGVMLTDMTTGGFTARIPESGLISVGVDEVKIGESRFPGVWMGDFLKGLAERARARTYAASHPSLAKAPVAAFVARDETVLTVQRFYDAINAFLTDGMVLLAETGDAICAAAELFVDEADNFLAQAYYMSIGYALPATLGACLADSEKRPVLIQGDGAFQMSAQELSTLIRNQCKPLIFLLNNQGYTIERIIHDGPYNEIQNWKYHQLPGVFGGGAVSLEVKNEKALEKALETALANPDKLVFVEVHFDPYDCSRALAGLGKLIRKLSGR